MPYPKGKLYWKIRFPYVQEHGELKSLKLIQKQISLHIKNVQSNWKIFNPSLQLFLYPVKYELL